MVFQPFRYHPHNTKNCYNAPDYKFDPDEAFADVCVTGADGAGAAPSATVAHASSSVSNVKRQTTITAFFK